MAKDRFPTGLTFLAPITDVAKILEGEEGTFKANFNGQVFRIVCTEGHSIESLVPAGVEYNWLITRLEDLPVETMKTLRTPKT
jgi:hypothetical protein